MYEPLNQRDVDFAFLAEQAFGDQLIEQQKKWAKMPAAEREALVAQAEAERLANAPPPVVQPSFDGVDISGDGGVFKRITRTGDASAGILPGSPTESCMVRVRYCVRTFDGRAVADSEASFCAGCHRFRLGVFAVMRAWDLAVGTMLVGERCLLVARSDYADRRSFDGAPGHELLPLPSSVVGDEAMLLSELELVSWQDPLKPKFDLSDEERLVEAKTLKDQGTRAFRLGLFDDACELYSDAADYVDQHAYAIDLRKRHTWHASVWPYASSLLCDCLLNAASAALRVGERSDEHWAFETAEKVCTRALAEQPTSVKALFRRGRARSGLGQFAGAKEDLGRARALQPDSREVRDALVAVAQREKRVKDEQRQRYARMFTGGGLYADVPEPATSAPSADGDADADGAAAADDAASQSTQRAQMEDRILSLMREAIAEEKREEKREAKREEKRLAQSAELREYLRGAGLEGTTLEHVATALQETSVAELQQRLSGPHLALLAFLKERGVAKLGVRQAAAVELMRPRG